MRETKNSKSEDRLEVLEVLVDELERNQPRVDVLQTYMKRAGIKYSSDNIENIDSILNEIRFYAGDLGLKSK